MTKRMDGKDDDHPDKTKDIIKVDLLIFSGCLSYNSKPCFFLLLGTNRVAPFLQTKMGLMMG
jgi:hypothetical protein